MVVEAVFLHDSLGEAKEIIKISADNFKYV